MSKEMEHIEKDIRWKRWKFQCLYPSKILAGFIECQRIAGQVRLNTIVLPIKFFSW